MDFIDDREFTLGGFDRLHKKTVLLFIAISNSCILWHFDDIDPPMGLNLLLSERWSILF
jgi:hypothetical protein